MLLSIKFYEFIRMLLGIAIISSLSFYPVITYAIVNMDGIHFDNKEKEFAADLDISISGTSGNSNTQKASLNTQLSWITEKSIHLVILGSQYGENNNVRSVNKSFMHYRYIHQLNNSFDWEMFGQLETNEFTRLSYRGLVGTGVRYSLAKSAKHHAFLGLGGFYSKEKTEITAGLTDDGIEEINRANFYLLSKNQANSHLSFSTALYYQPRLDRAEDFRALLETRFDFKINKELSFRLSLDIEHDSEPSQSIKKTDTSYMTGLVISF